MIRETEEQREAVRQAKAALAKAERPRKAIMKAQGRARRADMRKRDAQSREQKQRQPRAFDQGYISWLHDLPCIACLIEGRAPPEHRHIEAAHQKIGRQKALGRRPSDQLSVPLCAWDHRLGPDCCDPAQKKFWGRLGIDPEAFAKALHAAFMADEPGEPIVQAFANQLGERDG